MKKKWWITAGTISVCIGMLILAVFLLRPKEYATGFSSEYVRVEELPPLLSFTHYEKEEWSQRIDRFAKGHLSYRELSLLLEELGVCDYITYEKKAGYRTVPRAEFFFVYDQVVDLLDVNAKVGVENRVFIGEKPQDGTWLTEQGFEQIDDVAASLVKQYDMYQVYTIDHVISGLKEVTQDPVTWKNIFIHSTGEGTVDVLFEREHFSVALEGMDQTIRDTICDIVWQNGRITAIYKKEDTIQGKVLSYNEEQIEIEGYGTLKHSGNLKIYKSYGTVEQLTESKLIIGNLLAEFVVAEKEVCGIILREPATMEQIRVLLLNEEVPYYNEIYVRSDGLAKVEYLDQSWDLEADSLLSASEHLTEAENGYLKICPQDTESRLYLADQNGKVLSFGYQGSFEIRRYGQGYCVVNELPLEDYLTAVVPSEMPASYEMEALRAQAVCARSYACIQLKKDQYAAFAANVDDTTNYQVYNKQEHNERTTLAVRDTVGEVMLYQGQIAEAYFYSTSCGFSQSIDVWNMEGDQYGYLTQSSLLTCEEQPDISNEESFAAFIKDKNCTAYDSDGAYFRWKAELDVAGNIEAVNQALIERRSANPDSVQIFDQNGKLTDKEVSKLGNIAKIVPEERSSGGVLKKIRFLYEKGSVVLSNEYQIRKVLGKAVRQMADKNDRPITAMKILPSAAFTVVPTETGYVLYGGGYGHGIGLSQNGANGMAKTGLTYTDILFHFYHDITIENIYEYQEEENDLEDGGSGKAVP